MEAGAPVGPAPMRLMIASAVPPLRAQPIRNATNFKTTEWPPSMLDDWQLPPATMRTPLAPICWLPDGPPLFLITCVARPVVAPFIMIV